MASEMVERILDGLEDILADKIAAQHSFVANLEDAIEALNQAKTWGLIFRSADAMPNGKYLLTFTAPSVPAALQETT